MDLAARALYQPALIYPSMGLKPANSLGIPSIGLGTSKQSKMILSTVCSRTVSQICFREVPLGRICREQRQHCYNPFLLPPPLSHAPTITSSHPLLPHSTPHYSACIVLSVISIKHPTSEGQARAHEAAAQQTSNLVRSSFFYLSTLTVRTSSPPLSPPPT